MIQVVEKDFKDEKYFDAVRRWRLPYWDYYRPRGGPVSWGSVGRDNRTSFDYDCGIPDVFTFPFLKIRTTLKGDTAPFANPLLKFKFPAEEDGGLDTNDWRTEPGYSKTETTRYPGELKVKTLQEAYDHLLTRNENVLVQLKSPQDINLNRYREPILKHLAVMMKDKSYSDMSRYGTNANVDGTNGSLEGTVHGTYHGLIGDAGHMGDVPVAGTLI
jgi:tyrosinase